MFFSFGRRQHHLYFSFPFASPLTVENQKEIDKRNTRDEKELK
jgi:hypothetical protein